MEKGTKKLLTGKQKEDMQNILRLLVEFDEKTGRVRKYMNPMGHYLRKEITEADLKDIQFVVERVSEKAAALYTVYAFLTHEQYTFSTTWLHEDSIYTERLSAIGTEHPVHGITCLTDLYDVSPVISGIPWDDTLDHEMIENAENGAIKIEPVAI